MNAKSSIVQKLHMKMVPNQANVNEKTLPFLFNTPTDSHLMKLMAQGKSFIGNKMWTALGQKPQQRCSFFFFIKQEEGFPGGSVVKNTPANAGDTCSIPGPGRSHMPRSN